MPLFIRRSHPPADASRALSRQRHRAATVTLLASLLFGAAWALAVHHQSALDRARAQRWPAPGQRIAAGAHVLHLHCTGHGGPVMVLESGMGGWSQDWSAVQAPLSAGGQVCSYDRAGSGWSDDMWGRRDGRTTIDELRRALAGAAVTGPYILVGHSMGGLLVSLYARYYPNEVAGLAFIDAIGRDYAAQFPAGEYRHIRTHLTSELRFGVILAPLGIPQALGRPASLIAARLPPPERASAMDFARMGRQYHTLFRENAEFDALMAEVRRAGPQPAVPALVLGSTVMRDFPVALDESLRSTWFHNQASIADEAGVPLTELADTGHFPQVERPQAVAALLERLRATVRRAGGALQTSAR